MQDFFDAHVHSAFSPDAHQTPEQLVKFQKPMIITDHYDVHEKLGSPFVFDEEAYFEKWLPLRNPHLLIGIELGLRGEGLRFKVEDKPFDFVLGSVHAPFDREDAYEFVDQALIRQFDEIAFQRYYFEQVLKSIQARPEMDALAHLDYPMRYLQDFRREILIAPCHDLIHAILKELVHHDIALELNTARASQPVFYPEWTVLFSMYKEVGGRYVTVGSDAHRLTSLRRQFEEVIPFILGQGLEIIHFEKRTRIVDK